MRLDIRDERIQELLQAWGTPYVYGAGTPADGSREDWWLGAPSRLPNAPTPCPRGWDCSGFYQAAAVRLGLLAPTAGDRGAAALYLAMTPVREQDARLGDAAFYGAHTGRPTHVMVCLGGDAVLGAASGTPTTFGADPRAFVSLERIRYWSAFLEVRRVKP